MINQPPFNRIETVRLKKQFPSREDICGSSW